MKNLDKLPILIIVVGIIAAGFFFNSNNTLEKEISAAEKVKAVSDKQLEIYSNIDSHYGYSSKEFYSNKPIVVLNGSGATEVIRIYWVQNGKSPISTSRDENTIWAEWGENDGNWAPLTLTSKMAKGCVAVPFANEANDETFEVLVIVK